MNNLNKIDIINSYGFRSIYYIDNQNLEQGDYITYYPNGLISIQAYYINGIKHGLYRHYHENGILSEEREFYNGLHNGLCRSWYPNGILMES
jgi:antitoxin component YwqK of YwqJK toxin-antitoxin module